MRVAHEVLRDAAATTGVPIYDGLVTADNTSNIVTYPLPYAVYYGSIGNDPPAEENARLTGQRGRRSVYFRFIYVGATVEQAQWAGERIKGALQGKRFTYPGINKSWPVWFLDNDQQVRRDDDTIRPDGSPLFYGVSDGAVSLVLNH